MTGSIQSECPSLNRLHAEHRARNAAPEVRVRDSVANSCERTESRETLLQPGTGSQSVPLSVFYEYARANFIRQRCGSIPLPRFGGESSKWLGHCLANFPQITSGMVRVSFIHRFEPCDVRLRNSITQNEKGIASNEARVRPSMRGVPGSQSLGSEEMHLARRLQSSAQAVPTSVSRTRSVNHFGRTRRGASAVSVATRNTSRQVAVPSLSLLFNQCS